MTVLAALSVSAALLCGVAPYPLDEVSREVPKRGKLKCDREALVKYKGDVVPYHATTTVHPAFRERLRRFEKVVADVAVEVYGRAPRRIVTMGTFNCRRIRRFPHLISEHGLGNAIDVAGFDFGSLPAGAEAPDKLSKRHRRGFKVRMEKHWTAKGRDARHSSFLKLLARRLVAADIFRVLLGPAWPGHHNHFHFDMAPYAMVEIFKE